MGRPRTRRSPTSGASGPGRSRARRNQRSASTNVDSSKRSDSGVEEPDAEPHQDQPRGVDQDRIDPPVPRDACVQRSEEEERPDQDAREETNDYAQPEARDHANPDGYP